MDAAGTPGRLTGAAEPPEGGSSVQPEGGSSAQPAAPSPFERLRSLAGTAPAGATAGESSGAGSEPPVIAGAAGRPGSTLSADSPANRAQLVEDLAPAAAADVSSGLDRAAGRSRARRWWVRVLVVVCAALAGVLALALVQTSGLDAVTAERTAALLAARVEAESFTTLNYHDLPPGLAAVVAGAANPFRADFVKMEPETIALYTKGQVVSHGSVVAAGLESFSPSRAVAVIALNDSSTSTIAPSGQTKDYRFVFSLVHRDGRWLVSVVDLVP